MKNYLHIIYKNTSSLDFITPYYHKLYNSGKLNKLIIFVWDLKAENIKKNIINKKKLFNIPVKIYFLKDFLYVKKLIPLIIFTRRTLVLRYISYFLLKFVINQKNIFKILKSNNKIYLDNKNFYQIELFYFFFKILKKINKKIFLVPHAPHYRHLGEEYDNSVKHTLLKFKINYEIICSNKKNFNVLKEKNICYIGLPASDKIWVNKFIKIKRNYIGFIMRPFIKKYNQKKLLNFDYYISSYEDNYKFIKYAYLLNKKGYKILFRLHPSSNILEFKKNYNNLLEKFNYTIHKGSIYNFISLCKKIITFHSTAVIYAAYFKSDILLYNNNLTKKIYQNWPELKNLYNSICNEFSDFSNINFKKNKGKKPKNKLKEFW